jgi:hypothetical protein
MDLAGRQLISPMDGTAFTESLLGLEMLTTVLEWALPSLHGGTNQSDGLGLSELLR